MPMTWFVLWNEPRNVALPVGSLMLYSAFLPSAVVSDANACTSTVTPLRTML